MAALAHPELEKKMKKEEKGLLKLTLTACRAGMDRSYKGHLHNLSQLHEYEHHKAAREHRWGQVGSSPHVTATMKPKDPLPPRRQPE